MTVCDGNNVDFISGTGSDESGGIFVAGTYDYTAYDSYGDGMNGGASIVFETRAVGGTTWTAFSGTNSNVVADDSTKRIVIPSGEEFRLAYNCPGTSNCWEGENSMEITRVYPPPSIPAAAAGGAGGSPTGSEPADVTFTVASGEEAYFEFTSGNSVGDADEVEIYYRQAGLTGWSTYWDICSINPPSNPPCQQSTDYSSEDSVILQTPGSYELLVWDTLGDGSGTGAGGQVVFATLGSTTGSVATSPSGLRLNSLISSDQIVELPLDGATSTPTTVVVCNTVVTCNSGTMSMFTDVYKNGANGGYIEFALGFRNALNSLDGWTSGNRDITASFDDFYLVVELEDTTPDATPPTVEMDAHYTGVTSYVAGERTLFLALMDANNPVDTTTANGPKLHYSTDGGNSYTTVGATSSNACVSKLQVCGFTATTGTLSAGDTVDYYWSYSDAAANDNTKIPAQTPNPGRFPATGSADLTFTIADIYSAPTDGTDMKLVTYMDNIRHAEPHTGVSNGQYAGDVDQQMTYYANSGEYHFEFG